MRHRRPEPAAVSLLVLQHPGWLIDHHARTGLYRAARLHHDRAAPPFLTSRDPAALSRLIHDADARDTALTAQLRDVLYELRDRGGLPDWAPPVAA
ncbi:hypothetical protein [Marinitenerispora sediminis]|uniref:Uncharacterized protein n=1 Tax=Marinitenerispora sediminis TaxID=1931232 RepID=A0A368T5D9_9ACTN|nr:hypothetical protein [Marinitenerispora sediminis]RCV51850.1 hypothetical protein DEF28_14360 [Marinitenerispora sediminis]RCV56355.1 hypothetical protein DEF23_12620 [Marinitenerispora sediminis]RCV58690.1 hypothetical protein DEF24_12450 [Marinitenerispora sediminis]